MPGGPAANEEGGAILAVGVVGVVGVMTNVGDAAGEANGEHPPTWKPPDDSVDNNLR
jgi:hypothetical protein